MKTTSRSPFFWPVVSLFTGLALPTLIYIFLTDSTDYLSKDCQLHFLEKIYFSVVTFSTLGYGDISPLGWVKAVAALQALSGPITVGFCIYGYGKHAQAKEDRNREAREKRAKEALEITNFDLVQYFRRDVYRTYSHYLASLNLEYKSVFLQAHVCFMTAGSLSMYELNTHYYSFPRISFLVKKHIDNLKYEYLDSQNSRLVHRAQTLVNYHVASVQSLIMLGGQHVGVEKEIFERLTAQIRDGSALQARTHTIEDCKMHDEPIDSLVIDYLDSLQTYLEHVISSMKILTLAPYVKIASTESFHTVSASIEERLKFPEYHKNVTRDKINARDWAAS